MSPAHPAAIDLVELTLEQAEAAFADGSVTSEALTQAFLDRIEEKQSDEEAALIGRDGSADRGRRRLAGGHGHAGDVGLPRALPRDQDL